MLRPRIIPINRNSKSYKLYGLYCPYNDGLKYIGITTGLLSTRLSSHLRKPTNGKIAMWFKELKNNNNKPIIKLIKEYEDYNDLLTAEINEIKKNRELGVELYNIADGGDINPMFGKQHTEESKIKISKNNKGLKRSKKQIDDRVELLSKLWSDEEWSNNMRNKMSKNMIGNHRALGFKHSENNKEKISKLHKGNTYCLGHKHTEETKKKLSIINSGENNPMYGKKLPKEVLIKRSEKVKNEGTFKGNNNPNFKYNISKKELIDFYLNKNLKIDEIAKYYGCHRTVISKNIKKYNIIKPPSNKYNLNIYDIIKYKNNGFSLVEIGDIYGCSNKIIHKFIKKNKI
jgi:predicted DNA-binding protein YlxM (UPF0122 family)